MLAYRNKFIVTAPEEMLLLPTALVEIITFFTPITKAHTHTCMQNQQAALQSPLAYTN